jgi:anthranilate phosphoribosyltransferase
MITPQQALARLLDNNELFHDEMSGLMRQIMSAQVAPEMVAALLVALRMKVETVAEIAAAAGVMREFATPVPVAGKQHLVDIVGTGGDGAHTFNISSTAMFVAAAAGAKVAKHGGRSVSSSSGAADVMEQMGVSLGLSPGKGGAMHRRNRHGLYVCTQPPQQHAPCGARAQSLRRENRV